MLPVIKESRLFVAHLYFSTAGGCLAFVISLVVLLHTICAYQKQKRTHKRSNKNGTKQSQLTAYRLALSYFVCTTISSLSHVFIRTNAFTRIAAAHFTPFQCLVGFLMSYIAYFVGDALIYIIFAWRLRGTLSDSQYERPYHKHIVCVLCVLLCISSIVFCAMLMFEAHVAYWALLQHGNNAITMCTNALPDTGKYNMFFVAHKYLSLANGIYHFFINVVFLYMFVAGLWRMNKDFMEVFVAQCNMNSRSTQHGPLPSTTTDGAGIDYCPGDGTTAAECAQLSPAPQLGMKTVIDRCYSDERSFDSEIAKQDALRKGELILKLYDLMKKQTILVCTSVISSVLFWCVVFWNDWFWLQFHWDAAINVVCVWLMFGFSRQYWRICTKSCLRCCYTKENMINRR